MKCDMAPETLISLLYDELDLIEEKKVRKHIESVSYTHLRAHET